MYFLYKISSFSEQYLANVEVQNQL